MAIYMKPHQTRAALYIRTDPADPVQLSAKLQEQALKDYCASQRVSVMKTFVFECGDEESLRRIEQLLPTLQPEINTLVALRFHRFSRNLLELTQISMRARTEFHVDLYSAEFVSPLWGNLHNVGNL